MNCLRTTPRQHRMSCRAWFGIPRKAPRHGFSLIEIVIVGGIMVMGFAVFFRFMQIRSMSDSGLTNRLTLQIEARRAADVLIGRLREASEILRPTLGETVSYVAFLDSINQACLVYPTLDVENSAKYKKDLFRVLSFTRDPGGTGSGKESSLIRSVKRVAFTLLAPNSIQISITVANEKEEYQLLTEVGLMNFGANE
ncbi:MAG: hypothetical protein WA705_26430 [Candidatus Ozemobacteraceae bacterium]